MMSAYFISRTDHASNKTTGVGADDFAIVDSTDKSFRLNRIPQ
jgi:hypothetical protein